MKLSLPALLDAGRRFAASLLPSTTPPRPPAPHGRRQAHRGFCLLGITLATFLAFHPPSVHARAHDWQKTANQK